MATGDRDGFAYVGPAERAGLRTTMTENYRFLIDSTPLTDPRQVVPE